MELIAAIMDHRLKDEPDRIGQVMLWRCSYDIRPPALTSDYLHFPAYEPRCRGLACPNA